VVGVGEDHLREVGTSDRDQGGGLSSVGGEEEGKRRVNLSSFDAEKKSPLYLVRTKTLPTMNEKRKDRAIKKNQKNQRPLGKK